MSDEPTRTDTDATGDPPRASTDDTPPNDTNTGSPPADAPSGDTGGAPPGPVTAVAEPTEPTISADLLWRHAGFAAICVVYWAAVLALPPSADALPGSARAVLGVVAAVLFLRGAIGLALGGPKPGDGEGGQSAGSVVGRIFTGRIETGAAVTLAVAGLVGGIATWTTGRRLELDDSRRFALGVGGLAVVVLAVGLQQFKTVRGAGGAALLVLFIGAATWPDATGRLDADIRDNIITWTGIVLGVSVVAEAAKQATQAQATAKAVSALADAARQGGGSSAGFSVASREPAITSSLVDRLEDFHLAEPPGDLR